jgi:ribosomal protein S18 acetylase RimI-like enzyme
MTEQTSFSGPAAGVVVVRPAVAADHPRIAAIMLGAYGQYAGTLPPETFVSYLSDLVDLDHHAARGRLVVAELAGRVVGAVAYYPDISVQGVGWPEGWAGGRALAVDPAARGYGVARALVATCLRLAAESGAPVFAFHTAVFMTRAVALYEGLGFERAPEYDLDLGRYYGASEGSPQPVIAYRRDLTVRTTDRRRNQREESLMSTDVNDQVSRSGHAAHDEAFLCPTCGEIAEVEWRDWVSSTDGAVELVKIRCANRHWFLTPAERLERSVVDESCGRAAS